MRAIITVLGGDKVGIIYNVTKIVSEYNINILDISQTVMGGSIFTMLMLVDATDMTCEFRELAVSLDAIAQEFGVSIRVQREDIFNAMHSI
jgi:ACT domain-containing protein